MSNAQKSITITRNIGCQSCLRPDATYKIEVDGRTIEDGITPCEVYLGDATYASYSGLEAALLIAYRHRDRERGGNRVTVTMVTDEDVRRRVTRETYTFDGSWFSLVEVC